MKLKTIYLKPAKTDLRIFIVATNHRLMCSLIIYKWCIPEEPF